MPHAKEGPMNGNTAANNSKPNGTSPPSYKSLNHLKSYPIVSDSISVFEKHPLGQRSISLSQSWYSTFFAPFTPYLSKAAPLVNRADEFADSNLGKIESLFPIIKEPTGEIKSKVTDTIGYPRKLFEEAYVRGAGFAKEKKEHVVKVYEEECSKLAEGKDQTGVGYIPKAKAGVTAGLVVSSEIMGHLAAYLGNKKEDAKERVGSKTKAEN